jgi:hypothetical protein
MTQVDYQFFINHFRCSLAQKNNFFEVAVTTRTIRLIHLLYNLGIIRRFIKLTNKKYRIYVA